MFNNPTSNMEKVSVESKTIIDRLSSEKLYNYLYE